MEVLKTPLPPNGRPPLFMLLFFSLFGFIGIAVLIHLWTAKGFGAPPLIFRVFGSFIALGFIVMGFGTPLHALRQKTLPPMDKNGARPEEPPGSGGRDYDCPHCGANIRNAEVSPSGDVRCEYCDQWWNIHRS